jgi:hypothetical protein
MIRLNIGAADGEHIAIDLPDKPQGREGWFDAPVSIAVHGFIGNITAYFEVEDFCRFRKSLASVYETLSSKAELAHREKQLTLSVEGNGRGAISVTGVVYAHATHGSKLEFEFALDQTFLPEAIRAIQKLEASMIQGAATTW